ncbi:DNA polymerase IV [Fibrobacterota bacterium]
MPNTDNVILHVDMDAFYAAVEQRDHPEYRGKPVIVGSLPGTRGVVSAASYEAREFGIKSAMPINQAHNRCPQGIYVPPNMEHYVRVSKQIMTILREYTPLVEQISIDEAFLDITGTGNLWGAPRETAKKIQDHIVQGTGLTASVGIAPNKFLAKLASDINKPAGITLVPFRKDKIYDWLAPMPIGKIWGVGIQTQKALARLGVKHVADLQKFSLEKLQDRFGAGGASLYYLCRGIDSRTVGGTGPTKSISREHTFNKDTDNSDELHKVLLSLARDVSRQARKKNLRGKTIVFIYRTTDFKKHTRRITLEKSTCFTGQIFEQTVRLFRKSGLTGKKMRLIGVGLTGFHPGQQESLISFLHDTAAAEKSETAMDKITAKFGKESIFYGGEIIS